MEARFRERTVVLAADNIDTDQIIPARFLKTTSRIGLGRSLFFDWRFDERCEPRPEFALNHPDAADCRVLVAGDNFGCGSSREHAPWALLDYGFRAVISTSFADIFRNNSLKNGLLPIEVPKPSLDVLSAMPGAEVEIDLASRQLVLPGGDAIEFPIDPFAHQCLLEGVDELDFLLEHADAITRFEISRGDGPMEA